jgi:hypothetical protein
MIYIAYKNLRWPINNWPKYPISKTLHDTLSFSLFFFFFFLSPDQTSWPLNSTKASKLNMIINQLGITLKICIRNDTPDSSLFDLSEFRANSIICACLDISINRHLWLTMINPIRATTSSYIYLYPIYPADIWTGKGLQYNITENFRQMSHPLIPDFLYHCQLRICQRMPRSQADRYFTRIEHTTTSHGEIQSNDPCHGNRKLKLSLVNPRWRSANHETIQKS